MTPEIFFTIPGNDLSLYYNGCFVRVKHETQTNYEWAFIDSFAGAGQPIVQLQLEDRTISDVTKRFKWDFSFPQAGAYNFKNTVVILSRVPIRSTAKGMNKNNTKIINVMKEIVSNGLIPKDFYNENDFVFGTRHLNLLLENSQPVPFEKGMEKIHRKQSLAYAVNSRIIVSQGILSLRPTIWLKNRVVAELDVKKDIVIPLHEAFVPELVHAFVDKGIEVFQG
jgi:hypothetical protein